MDVVTTSPHKPTGANSGAASVLTMLTNRIPLGLLIDLAWPGAPCDPFDFTPADRGC